MSVNVEANAGRWQRRPGLARAYRVYVLAGPLVTLLGVVFFASELFPTSDSVVVTSLRWTVIASLAMVSAVLAERTLSRLLPVAALLDLDLGFPGAVPTRSRIASLASLRGGDAELMDLLPGIAERDLDAAAEHLMIRYASVTRTGLRPRSHIDRVRALATALSQRMDIPAADVDRLRWALLMRDVGSLSDDAQHPHQPLLEWLGPFAALVHGPYADAAGSHASLSVRRAAHATAVADAYVVLTAAHPYRRPAQPLPLDALTGAHLDPAALGALHSLSEQERRRTMGLTVGLSPLAARYTPRPQPVLTIASILAVLVLVVGIGIGPSPDTGLPGGVVTVAPLTQEPEVLDGEAAVEAAVAVSPSPSPRSVEQATEAKQKAKRKTQQRVAAQTSGTVAAAPRRADDTFSAQTYPDTSSSRNAMTTVGSGTTAGSGTTSAATTPKATTKPAPKPSSTTKPTTKPTAKPSTKPTVKPTVKPTPTPAPTPTPPPAPTPTPPADTDPTPPNETGSASP